MVSRHMYVIRETCFPQIALLSRLDHPNILPLMDIIAPPASRAHNFQELCLVSEQLEMDLTHFLQNYKRHHPDAEIARNQANEAQRNVQDLQRAGAAADAIQEAETKSFCCNVLFELVAGEAFVPLDTVRSIMAATMKGLTYVHSSGVLHRDLKPDNILIKRHPVAVAMDLAKEAHWKVSQVAGVAEAQAQVAAATGALQAACAAVPLSAEATQQLADYAALSAHSRAWLVAQRQVLFSSLMWWHFVPLFFFFGFTIHGLLCGVGLSSVGGCHRI
jgi:serine/threonine protein kinase